MLRYSKMASRATALSLIISLGLVVGCETSGQTGLLAGSGIGALAGQAIGGSTSATLIGAGVGAGVGYIIGNEKDKKEAKQKNAATPPAQYSHNDVGPLGGTRWQVVNITAKQSVKPYTSKIVEFKPQGRMITTTTNPDGTVDVANEHYRVVGQTLIINKPGYLINAKYGIQGDQLVVDCDKFSAVLKRIP